MNLYPKYSAAKIGMLISGEYSINGTPCFMSEDVQAVKNNDASNLKNTA
jgi:hypothetical protein